ncbi:hypothetical protein CRE_29247 [Caenorhabditis remanei]|uniref:Sdz-33 F-box domain-containing protein n=1 Tax=Caenorhabditis remanei TaxID=31234 RepID=E3NM05_CAERE|nr:hypothetical protein CRE_29247 [Caenorhabditis remanei]
MVEKNIDVRFENMKDTFEIFICSDSGISNNPHIQQYRIGGHIVPVMPSRIRITTFWKNYQEGFLPVIQHLLKMFQCKISTYYNCLRSDLFQPTISELFNQQLKFKTITIELNGSEEHNLLWNQISDKFELVETLILSSITDPGFKPIFTSWPQNICIRSSYWFTLEYLLPCTCTTITLEESHLGNKDLDEILRNWKAGAFQNLKCLKIYDQNITNIGATILGMNLRELDGKVIQTDDGSKKATIKNRFGIIEMSVTLFQ